MNSYDLAVADFLKNVNVPSVFQRVKESDYEEVAEKIFQSAAKVEDPANFRVYPDTDPSGYKTDKPSDSSRESMDVIVRCKSGNNYLLGFDYRQ